jgi:hypothetical protein
VTISLSQVWRATPADPIGVRRVTYTATCPKCGTDCDWIGNTSVNTGISSTEPRCGCGGAA